MCKESLNISQQKEWEKMIAKINQLENELQEQQKQYNNDTKELRNMGNNICSDYMDIKKKYIEQSKELNKLNKDYEMAQSIIKLREDENNYLYSYIIKNVDNNYNEYNDDSQSISEENERDLANAFAEYGIECDD